MTAYSLVIFDFDGTLCDSLAWFRTVFNDVAEAHGFARLTHDELESLRHHDLREMLRRLQVPLWKLPGIAVDMRRRMTADLATIRRFDGVDTLFDRLWERDVRIAIVSSNSEENVRAVLGPKNAERVSFFGCGSSLFGKAAKFRKVLRVSGVPRERILSVGDEFRDIDAARAEGLASGAVSWGLGAYEALVAYGPTEHYASFEQLTARLTGTASPTKPIDAAR